MTIDLETAWRFGMGHFDVASRHGEPEMKQTESSAWMHVTNETIQDNFQHA